jgi:dihydropteroate synthase
MQLQHTSFSDGGKFNTVPLAVERAFELVTGGADMIDIGGESSRPGSVAVMAEEEMERVIPVIRSAQFIYYDLALNQCKADFDCLKLKRLLTLAWICICILI